MGPRETSHLPFSLLNFRKQLMFTGDMCIISLVVERLIPVSLGVLSDFASGCAVVNS